MSRASTQNARHTIAENSHDVIVENAHASGALKKPSIDSGDSTEIYLRQIRSHDLLTAADELELSRRLEEAETAVWRLLLESSKAPAIIEHVRQVLLEHAPTSVTQVDFTGSAETLASVLRKLDHDRTCCTTVCRTVPSDPAITDRLFILQRTVEMIRERFIKSNLRLVISAARKLSGLGIPLSDLIQEGNIGLMTAVPRYDYRKGFRFSTYAMWWIRHALMRFIQDKYAVVRIPVNQHEKSNKINKHRAEFTARLGREPTLEELSVETQLSTHQLETSACIEAKLGAAISLDSSAHTDAEGPSLLDQLVDPQASVTEELISIETRRRVSTVLDTLSEIEADVIRKRFGIEVTGGTSAEMTLGEIGAARGLSRERIRQLEKQALAKLQRALRREGVLSSVPA